MQPQKRAPLPPIAGGPQTWTFKVDYPFLRAWGRMMGSYPYFVDEQVERARKEQAPSDAIYRDMQGRWARYSEIRSFMTRSALDGILREMAR